MIAATLVQEFLISNANSAYLGNRFILKSCPQESLIRGSVKNAQMAEFGRTMNASCAVKIAKYAALRMSPNAVSAN